MSCGSSLFLPFRLFLTEKCELNWKYLNLFKNMPFFKNSKSKPFATFVNLEEYLYKVIFDLYILIISGTITAASCLKTLRWPTTRRSHDRRDFSTSSTSTSASASSSYFCTRRLALSLPSLSTSTIET
jgi:hypothetical protein